MSLRGEVTMNPYTKINLTAAIGLPLLAVLGSLVIFGVRLDTQAFIFGTNGIPMLIGAVISALLLRTARRKGGGEIIALLPTLIPAGFGLLWYAAGVLIRDTDSGREYFAGPFYLLGLAIGTAVVATVICLVMRPAGQANQ